MYHSYAIGKKLTCLNCDKEVRFDIWQTVDIKERPDLLEKILTGSLHNAYCPYCQQLIVQIDSPLLIYRPDQDPLFIYSSAEETVFAQDQNLFLELIGKLQNLLGEDLPTNWREKVKVPILRSALPIFLKEGPEAAMIAQIEAERNNKAKFRENAQILLSYVKARSMTEMKTALSANFSFLTSFKAVGYINEIINAEQSESIKHGFIIKRDLLIHFREIGLDRTVKELGEEGTNFHREKPIEKNNIKNRNIGSRIWDFILKPFLQEKNESEKNTQTRKIVSQSTSEISSMGTNRIESQGEKNTNPIGTLSESEIMTPSPETQAMQEKILVFVREINAALPESEKMDEGLIKKLSHKLLGNYDISEDRPELPKIIILITGFSGPEPEKYKITKNLVFEARWILAAYDNARVLSIPEEISLQQGSTYAQQLGDEKKADIVFWGWYENIGSNVNLTLNVEILCNKQFSRLDQESELFLQKEIINLRSFTIKNNSDSQLNALISFIKGLTLFQVDMYQDALEGFSQALSLPDWKNEPENMTSVLFYRGQTNLVLKQIEAGIADYTEAIRLAPTTGRFYTNRGCAYLLMHQPQKALEDYTNAIKINPMDSTPFENLAGIYAEYGDHVKAVEEYSKAIEINPKDKYLYIKRGLEFGIMEEADKAILDFSMVIQLDPQNAGAFCNRGFAYSKKGEYANAILDFSQSIILNPKDEDVFTKRGYAYKMTREYDRAISDYSQAIQINASHPDTFIHRGSAFVRKGEFTKAFADYDQAILLDPRCAEAYAARAVLFDIKGEKAKSMADIELAYQLDSRFNELYETWQKK